MLRLPFGVAPRRVKVDIGAAALPAGGHRPHSIRCSLLTRPSGLRAGQRPCACVDLLGFNTSAVGIGKYF